MMRSLPLCVALLGTVCSPALASSFDRETHCITLASLEGSVGSFAQIAQSLDVGAGNPVRLVTTVEEIEPGRVVADLLKENGFRPDQANVTLVSHLNPDVHDLSRLAVGDRIFVPVLEAYDGNGWNSFIPTEPVDGFAVEARVAGQVAERAQQQVRYAHEQMVALASIHEGTELLEASELLFTEILPRTEQLTGWTSYNEFLGPFDQRIVQVGHADLVAKALSANASPESEDLLQLASLPVPEIRRIWKYEAEKISVTLNVFDREGEPLEGLDVWYTSLAMQQLDCGRRHARQFSSPSHAAQHFLGKASFVFWVEDPRTRRTSKTFSIDFRQFGTSHMRDIQIEWEDD